MNNTWNPPAYNPMPAELREAAAHWRALAAAEDRQADFEAGLGFPYGDIGVYRYRANLYRQVANEQKADAVRREAQQVLVNRTPTGQLPLLV